MADNKYQTTPDTQIWNDFLNGDKKAFNTIYIDNIQTLYRYGLNFSQDESLIKDCIHDVFVDLNKYRSNLKSTNNIQLYLFKALKNAIIRTLNKNKKQYNIEKVDVPFYYEESFEEVLIENDSELYRINSIREAFSALSARQKEALYLKFNSGLDYDEISSILNINYQSARNLVHRSIEKLRESYRKSGVLILFSLLKTFSESSHNNQVI